MSKRQKSEEVEVLEQQVVDLTEALQRERADVINVRRRHEEQMAGVKDMVKVQIITEILPIVDNFDRALKHVPENLKTNEYIKGVQTVVKQFEKTLGEMGVERIKTVNEPFNPELHEAVGIEEGDGEQEVIIEELQTGYILSGQVIRHAMVKVKRA